MFILLLLTILSISLCACSLQKIQDYKDQKPELKLEEFFSGKVNGTASFFDWAGRVKTRFQIALNGDWDGQILTLNELITYSTGVKESRIWKIKKLTDSTYEGETTDVIGKAIIKISGNAAQWNYIFNVKVDDSTYALKFDDWMYLQEDGFLLNRAKARKFGIKVGELFIAMKKES